MQSTQPIVGSACCPHCASDISPAPIPFGQSACTACHRKLWYLSIDAVPAYFRYADAAFVRELFAATLDKHLQLSAAGFDSIDAVELIVEFEDALAAAI